MQFTYVFKPRFCKKAIVCKEMDPIAVGFSQTLDPEKSFRVGVSLPDIRLPDANHIFSLSFRERDCAVKSLVLSKLLQSKYRVFINDFCK